MTLTRPSLEKVPCVPSMLDVGTIILILDRGSIIPMLSEGFVLSILDSILEILLFIAAASAMPLMAKTKRVSEVSKRYPMI